MAAIYYKYRTDFNNILVAQSGVSFSNFERYEKQVFSGTSTVLNGDLFHYKYDPDKGTIVECDYNTLKLYTGYTYYINLPVQYSTLSNLYVSKNDFQSYTAATVNMGVSDLEFSQYTGNTAPIMFLSKTSFNTYSGGTLTNINTRALKTTFNTFTGTTAPATYQSRSSILTLTGTTLPATYQTKASVTVYTGATNTRLNTIENNYVTGSTNLGSTSILSTKSGRNLQFKGLVGGKHITVSANTTNVVVVHTPEVFYKEKIVSQNSTSSSFADYDTTTVNLSGGDYKITYSIIWGHSATNQNINIEFRRAGANIFPQAFTTRAYVNTSRYSETQVKVATLAAGSHTFSTAFSTAGGTATMYYSLILIERL